MTHSLDFAGYILWYNSALFFYIAYEVVFRPRAEFLNLDIISQPWHYVGLITLLGVGV